MRIAHILKIDAKGEAACVARGPYHEVKARFGSLSPGKSETLELWSPGWLPKRKRADEKQVLYTKQKPDSIEALRADLRKQGVKPEEIEKAVAASKLPSIADKKK